MTESVSPLLLTLGYGKRSIDEAIELLKQYGVRYLVDVRSAPYSRYHPDFSHNALKRHLEAHDITYVLMGKELGGKRGDKEYQADDGKVDYEKRRQSLEFQHGIKRLRDAWDQGLRLALLCSESRPEYCHRSRVIGPALEEVGIEVTHLDEDGTPMTQQKVMTRLAGGQQSLPGMAPPQAARSRHRYRTGQE